MTGFFPHLKQLYDEPFIAKHLAVRQLRDEAKECLGRMKSLYISFIQARLYAFECHWLPGHEEYAPNWEKMACQYKAKLLHYADQVRKCEERAAKLERSDAFVTSFFIRLVAHHATSYLVNGAIY
jgi:hypothetical protein